DAEVLPQIFDPFFTTKDVGLGLGLGLSIAYKIVHDFSGTLAAENDEAGGARFVMRIPMQDAQTLAAE
ncbi:MAG: ATP-binding protein, partial [Roseibium sp.]